jgi:hypothetical protein
VLILTLSPDRRKNNLELDEPKNLEDKLKWKLILHNSKGLGGDLSGGESERHFDFFGFSGIWGLVLSNGFGRIGLCGLAFVFGLWLCCL